MRKITCWACKQLVEKSNTAFVSEVHPFQIDIWANTLSRYELKVGNIDHQRICHSCIRNSLSLGYFDFKNEILQPQAIRRSDEEFHFQLPPAVHSGLDGILDGVTGAMMVTSRRFTWLSVSDLMKYGAVGLKESGAWLIEFRLPHPLVNFCHMCFSSKLRRHPYPIMFERMEPELVGGFCFATVLRFLVRRATFVWSTFRFGTAVWRGNYREALVGTASLAAGHACGLLFECCLSSIVDDCISPPYSSSNVLTGAGYIVYFSVTSNLVAGLTGFMMRNWLLNEMKKD
ncbi:Hypothetical predicted protein [Cloeon dipterum]|uniref:Uncharacterized protein n=1 Tax=Cloeon dipterum TaxID=197152 RepID=A0A8S1DBK9_9INSE|nr:Hypothetical predicted protein [Cloeon dipterum]